MTDRNYVPGKRRGALNRVGTVKRAEPQPDDAPKSDEPAFVRLQKERARITLRKFSWEEVK